MKKGNILFALYLLITIVLPGTLWYPSFIYFDLAGMGGYDGFASVELMEQHGEWSSHESPTIVYYLFEWMYVLWLLSFIHIPIAILITLKKYWRYFMPEQK